MLALFEIFTQLTPQGLNRCSKSLQHDQCNSGQLSTTHATHTTHATNMQMQWSNKNAVEVVRKCDNLSSSSPLSPWKNHQEQHRFSLFTTCLILKLSHNLALMLMLYSIQIARLGEERRHLLRWGLAFCTLAFFNLFNLYMLVNLCPCVFKPQESEDSHSDQIFQTAVTEAATPITLYWEF